MIIAPHHRLKTYKVFTFIIVIFNIVFFSLTSARADQNSMAYFASLVACLSLAAPALQYFIFGNKEAGLQNMLGGVLIAGICWSLLQVYLNGLAMILVAVLGLLAIRPIRFVFNKNGLIVPGLPSKKVTWADVENVVVKEGMLTIDFKNNKLIQFSLQDAENNQFDTVSFNKFVTDCLASAQANSK